MKLQVRFRFNKRSGEVEEFLVDDQGSNLSEAEHNRRHDQVAGELGRLIERHALVRELAAGSGGIPADRRHEPPAPDTRPEDQAERPERRRTRE
jgi:hypothetical protein